MKRAYTISELARDFGVTPRTIRHYEDEGLIRPARTGAARSFSPRDRARLKLALLGKRLGFTLGELRELFELYNRASGEQKQMQAFLAKLREHRTALEQRRVDLELMLNEIGFFETQCLQSLDREPAAPLRDESFTRT